jgi:hypothetical protein
VPDTDPRVWARGKTAQEVLGIAGEVVDHMQTFVRSGAPPAQPTQPAYQPPAAPSPPPLGNEDYVTGANLDQWGQRAIQQHVQPSVNAAIEMAASSNLGQIQQKYGNEFQRYGPTIWKNLSSVPKTQWTLDNLDRLVRYSLTETSYVEDQARVRAERIVAEMGTTVRSGGGSSGYPAPPSQPEYSLEDERLPPEWRAKLKEKGITMQTVSEFCQATGTSVEAYFKTILPQAITETPRR